jgi:tRNA(Ile)-lysidine synthase
LHLLASIPALNHRLLAVHINHGISPNALGWQQHCEQWCEELNIAFRSQAVEFNRESNIEEGARTARFAVFSSLLNKNGCLLLGHHLDDQAETLLLQLFRGAGIDGLSSMSECSTWEQGVIARPLLSCSREQIKRYALEQGLVWIEDESNEDSAYTRNYLRHHIMPLLVQKWPGVVGNLARTASHCQEAQLNLDYQAMQDCGELLNATNSLSIEPLSVLSEARIFNVLRVWLKQLKIKRPSAAIFKRIVHEVFYSRPDATPLVSWGTVTIRRYNGQLWLEQQQQTPSPECTEWPHFPEPLVLAGGACLSVINAKSGLMLPDDAELSVRFRQGGETMILHKQTKQLKKLFQEWNVPTWDRERVPLLYVNEQLAAVIGYAVSDVFYTDKEPARIVRLHVRHNTLNLTFR